MFVESVSVSIIPSAQHDASGGPAVSQTISSSQFEIQNTKIRMLLYPLNFSFACVVKTTQPVSLV